MLTAALLSLVATTIAWFIPTGTFNNIIVTTGYMEVDARLFAYEDFNSDGVIDRDESGSAVLANIDFSIAFPSLDRLKEDNSSLFTGKVNLNGYKNISFKNMKIVVSLEQTTEKE